MTDGKVKKKLEQVAVAERIFREWENSPNSLPRIFNAREANLDSSKIKLKVMRVSKNYAGVGMLGEDWLCWSTPGESERIIDYTWLPLNEALSINERADPKFWELMMIFWIYTMPESRELWRFFGTKRRILKYQVFLYEMRQRVVQMEFDEVLDRVLRKPRQFFMQRTALNGIIDTLAQFPPTGSRRLMLDEIIFQAVIDKLRIVLELDNSVR